MNNLSSSHFLRALLALFFCAVGLDVLMIMAGMDRVVAGVLIYALFAGSLAILLHGRLAQLRYNRAWSALALFPPIGYPFGLYLYMVSRRS